MSRRPVATTVAVATLAAALLTGCTSEDAGPPPDEAPVSMGWNRLTDPVAVDLPAGTPIAGTEGEVDPDEPVLVNFWASWCVPCQKEMPLLVDAAERGDIEVVGVSLDRFEDEAVEFLGEYGADYPNWRDPDMDLMSSYAPAVSPAGLPSSVLVVDGEVVASHIGEFTTPDDLSADRLRELAG
ncbi:TlpA family protein disulfide reductase [Nocardioides sp. SYSU DS0663]|uniref:TlpA family protein disulfide reductase n=1 Tax=Nocardioides sp. SYSU DS0663 TaxID=3416445 RepID=UPI003F4B344C